VFSWILVLLKKFFENQTLGGFQQLPDRCRTCKTDKVCGNISSETKNLQTFSFDLGRTSNTKPLFSAAVLLSSKDALVFPFQLTQ
jgi:hypothetical protein